MNSNPTREARTLTSASLPPRTLWSPFGSPVYEQQNQSRERRVSVPYPRIAARESPRPNAPTSSSVIPIRKALLTSGLRYSSNFGGMQVSASGAPRPAPPSSPYPEVSTLVEHDTTRNSITPDTTRSNGSMMPKRVQQKFATRHARTHSITNIRLTSLEKVCPFTLSGNHCKVETGCD